LKVENDSYFFQFAQLIRIRNRLGREKFPLVEQTFYPSHKQMVSGKRACYAWIMIHFASSNFLFKVRKHVLLHI